MANNKVKGLPSNGSKCQAADINWWCFSLWMKPIGLYPLTPNGSNINRIIYLSIRYGLWVINLITNLAVFVNTTETPSSFNSKYNYNQTNTKYWNYMIDYWNWSAHNIGAHSCIVLFVTRKNKWIKLIKILAKIDNALQSNQSLIIKQRKRINIAGILFIFLSVILH